MRRPVWLDPSKRGEWAGGRGIEGAKGAYPAGPCGQGEDCFNPKPREGLELTQGLIGALWRPRENRLGVKIEAASPGGKLG